MTVLLTREYYRVMAFYGWNPRIVDELRISELVNAYFCIPTLKKDQLRDMAAASRMAMAKQSDYKQALRSLED